MSEQSTGDGSPQPGAQPNTFAGLDAQFRTERLEDVAQVPDHGIVAENGVPPLCDVVADEDKQRERDDGNGDEPDA